MSKPEPAGVCLHEDADLFREAVNFTAAETAFPARLIEKDYFSTVLLEYLAAECGALVFKGGTCLEKFTRSFTGSVKIWISSYPCRATHRASSEAKARRV